MMEDEVLASSSVFYRWIVEVKKYLALQISKR